jgi:hypothetical protein
MESPTKVSKNELTANIAFTIMGGLRGAVVDQKGKNMEEAREKEFEGAERRAHPRFHIAFPAFLRLSVIREGSPTILETGGETVDISLEGVKISIPEEGDVVSAIEDAKEGRGVDAGVEIVTDKKRIKAVGDIRWFSTEAPGQVFVGIYLKGMGREDRKIWEDVAKSLALSL